MLTRGVTRGGGGGSGVSDHGALTGLSDDDHPQYLLRTDATNILAAIVVASDGSVVTAGGEVVWAGDPGAP
jgi:hypothetical protein